MNDCLIMEDITMQYYTKTKLNLYTNPNINIIIIKDIINEIRNFKGDTKSLGECFMHGRFDVDTKEWFYWTECVQIIRKTIFFKIYIEPASDTLKDDDIEQILYNDDYLLNKVFNITRSYRIFSYRIYIRGLSLEEN